jgi:hypothetical protein
MILFCGFQNGISHIWGSLLENGFCYNPTLRECEDETHTPKMGTWESTETPKILEFDCRGQNTSHWNIPYVIGKLSKHRC